MNLSHKLILFSITIIIYIFAISFFWGNIQIPFSNIDGSVGILTIKKINPLNDTLRFIIFIIPPLILNFIFIRVYYKKSCEKISSFFYYSKTSENILKLNDLLLIILILFVFITIEFFQLDFPSITYLDSLHDGVYLEPIINYIHLGGYWASSFPVHGGENIFLPLLALKIFDSINVTGVRYIFYIITFFIKFLSLLLAFQISQISKLEKNYKLIFFVILSFFILSLSSYQKIDYINIRDLFVLIFFIILIQMYVGRFNILLIYLLTLSTVLGFIFHFDTGVYLNATILLILTHSILSKKLKGAFFIILFLIINWFIVFKFFGLNEMTSMFDQFLHLALNMDKMHGLEYPQPFASIGDGDHGSRATKVLVFLLILGFITTSVVFLKNNYFKVNEKCLLIVLYFYSIISFKNALGRSDGPHIMVSSDWPSILLCFYSLHLIFYNFPKFFRINLSISTIQKTLALVVLIIILSNININKLQNYKFNFERYIKNDDKTFINEDRKEIIEEISNFTNKETCIQNFTIDLSLLYFLNKPSCTKFSPAWIVSGKKMETKYINLLKEKNVKYIIYSLPTGYYIDGISTAERLKFVNSFIQKNYEEVLNIKGYILLKK